MNPVVDHPAREAIRVRLLSRREYPALPSCGDPAWRRWTGRPDLSRLAAELHRRALVEAGEALPELPDELYREFHERGTRDVFQAPYFERRRRLGRAAIVRLGCEPVDEEVLTASLVNKLEEIMTEDSWALPAHVKNPDGKDRFCIDLASAETANLVAECAAVFAVLLGDDLRQRILARLRVEYFENYLAGCTGSGWWATATNNWNAVCHHGVAGAALAIEDDLDLVAAIIERTGAGLAHFLGGFTPDGGCTEGPDYWGYGFGSFAALNERLEARSGGALSLFDGDPRIAPIARYAPALSLAGGHIVNFSDAKDIPLSSWLLGYAGARIGDASCLAQGAANGRLIYGDVNRPVSCDGFNDLFAHWHRVFRFTPPLAKGADVALTPDVLMPDLGVWVARGRAADERLWEVAAKAGHNAEHHNHNDVGSFILNIDGIPLIKEIGAPEYVRNFFLAARRYEFLAARSLGHSLPVINGREQAVGREFGGEIVRADRDLDPVEFIAELGGAFPADAGLRRWTRRLVFDKPRGQLTWEDRFELGEPGEIESALIVDAPEIVRLSPVEIQIRKEGVSLRLCAVPGVAWDRIERHDYRDHWCRPRTLSRLVLKSDLSGREQVFQVVIGQA